MWTTAVAPECVAKPTAEVDSSGNMVARPKRASTPPLSSETVDADVGWKAEQTLARLAEDQRLSNAAVLRELGDLAEGDPATDDIVSEQSAESSSDEDRVDLLLKGEVAGRAVYRSPAFWSDTSLAYVHSKYGTFHLGKLDCPDLLACGRAVGPSYRVVQAGETVTIPKCRICFGSLPDAA